jgi:citrate/tricarballylate utilization protein
MPDTLLAEAERQLTICNACRYCEGLCPVFVALERRGSFLQGDVDYLANLCHECRACVPACPYTPPHELAVDISQLLGTVRRESYAAYTFPRAFGMLFRPGSRLAGVAATAVILLVVALSFAVRGDRLFQRFSGPGAFYEVIPWLAMLLPALAGTAYALLVFGLSARRFWIDTRGPLSSRFSPRMLWEATTDVLLLRQMHGGGEGCTYPEDKPSHRRVLYHQLVFYGFLGTFASTVIAAILQDLFHQLPPYPLWSAPVVLGTVGGLMQVIGCGGLLILKARAIQAGTPSKTRDMDALFLGLLLLVNANGLLLLGLRETAVMGILLAFHLATVAGLFLTLPYGKFVHVVYRYVALVRNRQEDQNEALAARAAEA